MKYTLLVTQECNLNCHYCYIGKKPVSMPLSVASRIIDFIFQRTPKDESIHIGFFGGEPLLVFELIQSITDRIEKHPGYDKERVDLAIVTNGTIFSEEIAGFVNDHDISFGISCDGPSDVHDISRCYPDGRGSSHIVAHTIARASTTLNNVMVNAVYNPQTLSALPQTVGYLCALGVRQIHLNPDIKASWSPQDMALLPKVYRAVADCSIKSYQHHNPIFISFIDSKIAVILRGGYHAQERCQMGRAEMSFTPDGGIYPCERLVGDGTEAGRIGDIDHGVMPEKMACRRAPTVEGGSPCADCSLQRYCMHWCGCTNFFATGFYNRVNSFICASEKAAIHAAMHVFDTLGPSYSACFSDHAGGFLQGNIPQTATDRLPSVSSRPLSV